MTFEAFKEKYFTQCGNGRYRFKNQYCERDVTAMIGRCSIIVRKADCLDLPEFFSTRRELEPDNKTRELYSKVLNNFITEIVSIDGQLIHGKIGSHCKIEGTFIRLLS